MTNTFTAVGRSFGLILMVSLIFAGCTKKEINKRKRVLIFSKTEGYRHQSIATGIETLTDIGENLDYDIVNTENSDLFYEDTLQTFDAVVFLNTSGDVFNAVQQADFERFIQAGGGFVGIHSATTTEYDWPWYNNLVGAYFDNHPDIQKAVIKKVDNEVFFPDSVPDQWEQMEEWYNFKSMNTDVKVLLTLDENSYKGGTMGKEHPITWYHNYDGGRSFYTGLGHTDEIYKNPNFRQILKSALAYAAATGSSLDYKKAVSKRVPEENRFSKVVLDFNLYEPTELAVLPDDQVLFIQRRGEVRLYKPGAEHARTIATLNVYSENEDGLMGLAIDPNFKKNRWIYLYYSPAGEEAVQHLSRFELRGDELLMNSEKVLLVVAVQREECCHTGGSIAFGPDGNLFLSTGDNTNPFASKGFDPIDEREGRSAWDAQKSSSNTNDLRGKILRIHPENDGSYTIPKGNLFPEGKAGTRPEIYVMGCRNPYRISVDQKSGYLYWGEVGPDAGESDSLRGPRGHDEINIAKQAGFFGWPYFVGNNKPYRRYDFATKEPGKLFDPQAPVNLSPNNTGLTKLPPAQPAFIWYPYASSPEFPIVGDGGRNAMAGPVYYSDLYKDSEHKFPDYFDGKLFIYDWIRNWILLVSRDEQGNLVQLEPFIPHIKFNNLIDMAFSDDGVMYTLEYGTGWFQHNMDARLSRIDYNGGNRQPIIQLTETELVGKSPLKVDFSAENSSDPDRDQLKYQWFVNNRKVGNQDTLSYVFDAPGEYSINLTAVDDNGGYAEEKRIVRVGNEPPDIKINIQGNNTFYWKGRNVKYQVSVSDEEDGSTDSGDIAASNVKVLQDYLEKGYDITEISQGHQMPVIMDLGESLIADSDCKSCHKVNDKSIGPSFTEVAKRYKGDAGAVNYLSNKIINGGGGVWGEQAMSAHPQLPPEDVAKMAKYILSLGKQKSDVAGLPLKGQFKTDAHDVNNREAMYMLSATYIDKGNDLGRLQSTEQVTLRNLRVQAEDYAEGHQISEFSQGSGNVLISNIKNGSYLRYDKIDITDLKAIKLRMDFRNGSMPGGNIEMRLDDTEGQLLGTMKASGSSWTVISQSLPPTAGIHNLYIVFKNQEAGSETLCFLDWIEFAID